ncbi:MAG: oligopeptide transporter, OPT family [Thermoanaerobaculales bacterium]|jgi:putative OPT family oligopeptide transporter|nr:oligopeptide transporter, OPT family [Thermoanaerobaculales bacterium]
MAEHEFKPYVPASSSMAELTFKAVLLGVVMAVVLGAANAYLGMKVGLTVAATFPAAVVAMAALRIFRGNILEENIARTTASVGESLVAGAIFTIPAFLISGAWSEFDLREATAIMLIGGVLGVLFVIILRRALVVEAELPFPESVAAAEIVKAGQKGQTGAGLVFGAMGIAALWELFKNDAGLHFIRDRAQHFVHFGRSAIEIVGNKIEYAGGMLLATPEASPMVMGVGFIVGLRISAILFAGAVAGWLVLVPLALFLNPGVAFGVAEDGFVGLAVDVWFRQIRPLAVGTMIVSAFYTLYTLRGALTSGVAKVWSAVRGGEAGAVAVERTEADLNLKWVLVAIAVMAVPMFMLYRYFAASTPGALVLTGVMLVLGVLFAAVAGYLVGLVGNSNNPISGLTLSALVISAVLMVVMGVTGAHGLAAVLGVAGVVCCAAGVAGDMMQDFKVGHILGGTPWKMQVAELIGVVAAAVAMPVLLMVLDSAYTIGSADLPAPQAGLMALMGTGIVGGEMAWPLVIVGMFFGVALILIKAPAPMLFAVGMYLPFPTTSAVFAGGVVRAILDGLLARGGATDEQKMKAENSGVLVASGLIAGQSLMAVLLAFVVLYEQARLNMAETEHLLPALGDSFGAGLLVYPLLLVLLVWLPLRRARA